MVHNSGTVGFPFAIVTKGKNITLFSLKIDIWIDNFGNRLNLYFFSLLLMIEFNNNDVF